MSEKPLRVVTFNVAPFAYNLITRWIQETNNNHILAVTTPGSAMRATPAYIEIVKNAPRDVDILVTTRLRKVATPLIRELKPDLILCFSFPYKLTPELISIPRIGAVNLHPTVLPAYRGPNIARLFYEGWHEYGVTIHWMDADFDTGPILSQRRVPMPDEIIPDKIFPNLMKIAYEALTEGLEMAIRGEPGTPQEDSHASYAAPFAAEEYWLDVSEPRSIIKRKAACLNFSNPGAAKIRAGSESYRVMSLESISEGDTGAATGQIIAEEEGAIILQAGDGPIRFYVEPLNPGSVIKLQ